MTNKVCMLQKTFGGTDDYWLNEVDGAWSNAKFNWAMENEARIHGNGLIVVGLSYIGQEREKIKNRKA